MRKWLDPWWLFRPKDFLSFAVFVLKWSMLLVSASIEIPLRSNFGRRYLPRLSLAVGLCCFCFVIEPQRSALSSLFVACLLTLFVIRAHEILTRRWRGALEPYTFSTGDSWSFWSQLHLSETALHRYFEPGLSVVVGLIFARIDSFISNWLFSAGIALFIKEQIERAKIRGRVFDSIDAKHTAQTLNTAIQHFQQHAGPRAKTQKTHRAQLPP